MKKELGMLQSISDATTQYFGLTQFQYGFLSYDPIDYQNQYIIQLDIFLEHYHEVDCRKYKKIQEVMAEISGFGSIALVVINFIFLRNSNFIIWNSWRILR